MKKIAYLVAPLMVMPFLIGCNKVKTHKVVSVQTVDEKLTFTTIKGKYLENSAFNHKQDFKFKVEANNSDVEGHYTVDPNGIGIYVGKDALMPLLDGYTVEYTKEDKTAATVTVLANKVTDDIYIRSIAAKEGSYIYSIPVMLGVRLPENQRTLYWHAINSDDLVLKFEGTDENDPTADCFLYTNDAKTFHYDGEPEENSWMSDHVTFTPATGGEHAKVKIIGSEVETGYFLIVARNTGYASFLDALSWDEIKDIANDGLAPVLFNLGDEKKITINNQEHKVRIIGFGHDTLTNPTDRAKAAITFQFVNPIMDVAGAAILKRWNNVAQARDFESAELNTYLKKTVFGDLLPEDLRNNIVTVKKSVGKFDDSSETWSAQPYDTELFLLSIEEITVGEDTSFPSYVEEEGTQYAYYKIADVEDRKIEDNHRAVTYWLRSPNNWDIWIQHAEGVANCVTPTGAFSSEGSYVNIRTQAIVPAFCI